jgi:putative transcriptional regulator
MATVKAKLDRRNPPRLSEETKTRLARLSDEQLTANALADPDNPPLTERELERVAAARAAQRLVRKRSEDADQIG